MHNTIALEDALKLDNPIFIDMRSPSEFEHGHIPGAVNVPLFSDSERAEVGTIYKQQGPEPARMRGLAIVSIKLPDLVSQIREFSKADRTVILYCWRGGMRSKSVVTVLDLMGIKAFQLVGGYKAYRRHVLDSLADFVLKPQVVVLCGSTGVGKTSILARLAQRNIPVIDLEKLANHRGSVFGQIGLGKPATAQNFDALILDELKRFNDRPLIVVECESKRIGNVYLPDVLYTAIQTGSKILVYADIEIRITRLIEEYVDIYQRNHGAILNRIKFLEPRLGAQKTENLIRTFTDGKMREVVRVLLTDYYDPLYGYEKADQKNYDLTVDATDLEKAVEKIAGYLEGIIDRR